MKNIIVVRRVLPVLFLVPALVLPVRGDEILERILVKVNGDIISKTDLEQRQISYLRQRNLQASEQDLSSDAELRRVLAEATPEIIADAIDEMLLAQRGRELGYRLTEEQFKSVLENIKKENNILTDEQFNAALAQEGMTMSDLRRALERQMLISRVTQQEILGRVGITEEEAREYYARHPEEFTVPASVTLREILIAVPADGQAVNVAAEEAARERAEALRARAQAGEDFVALVEEASDAPSKANGGLVGPVNLDELAPALREIVETLQPGQVAEPWRTARGYHLIRLEGASAAALQPFDEVRDQIADRVFDEKRRIEFEKYLERLRAQAIIEWRSPELKSAWERHLGRS
jgi:peptidyl-prolyl cis-trans isomerase SurA